MLRRAGRAGELQRAVGGVGTLLGEEGLARLRTSHVVVVGLGGVGSWTVEALARTLYRERIAHVVMHGDR